MNLRQIEAFRAVMIAGTETEAAKLLHTSQPAISYLIRQFEHTSDLKLFQLHRGRLVPTPEASALFQEVERSYAGMNRIKDVVVSLQNSGIGRISIGTVFSLAMSIIPDAMRAFLESSPDVRVSLQAVRSAVVRDGVARGLFDLGFAAEEIDASGVDIQPLASVRAVCVVKATHPLAKRPVIGAGDLKNVPLIMVDQTDLTRRRIEQVLADAGCNSTLAVETSHGAMVCTLALRGIGVGLVNSLIATDFSEKGLVIKAFEPAVSFGIYLLFPSHTPPSRLSRRFAAFVRAELLRRSDVHVHKAGR